MARKRGELVDMLLSDINATIDHLRLRRTGLAGSRRVFFSKKIDRLVGWRDALLADRNRVFDLYEQAKEACDEWRKF